MAGETESTRIFMYQWNNKPRSPTPIDVLSIGYPHYENDEFFRTYFV